MSPTPALPPPSRTRLVAAFATLYLVWGSTYLAIKVLVESMPPLVTAGARFVVAGSVIALVLGSMGKFRPTAKQWRDNALAGALLMLCGNGVVSWSEQAVPSGIATLIVSVSPLFIVLFDWLVFAVARDGRGTRPSAGTFLGLGVGFAGLGLLVGPSVFTQGEGGFDTIRLLGLVGACVSWGAGTIFARYVRGPAEPFTASALQMLWGGLFLLLAGTLGGEWSQLDLGHASAKALFAWGYLVVAGSLVGFTTFTWLMKHAPPARVATYAYVNPIVAVFLGWLVLDEVVSPRLFVAAAVIIAGVVLVTISARRREPVRAALEVDAA